MNNEPKNLHERLTDGFKNNWLIVIILFLSASLVWFSEVIEAGEKLKIWWSGDSIARADTSTGKRQTDSAGRGLPEKRDINIGQPTPALQPLNTELFFDKTSKADVAILSLTDFTKLDLNTSGILGNFFTSKGLSNNSLFFNSLFISKFKGALKNKDFSVFKTLGAQKNINCVCFVNKDSILEVKEYESIPFVKCSASYEIVIVYLNKPFSPQIFQFNCQGVDSDKTVAQKNLDDSFINSFKNLSINFDQCKK